ncbi:galactokinase [Flavobacterium sp. SUN052]|uniref:galactokinase n=1 Tax=Flavobacterium sp. SUN052 TaxID=3002441 RepID=UPI00237E03EA|nr:galactokinase [Flavobacterium sp. SUN052]MEC4004576.1 galactokinase [Flavobacterium sp. SUN052]
MKKKLIKNTSEHFDTLFHNKPQHIFLSPGRINIIGEHIDYNDGFVLPAAINKYVCIAISPNEDSKCKIVAKDLNEIFEFDLNDALVPNSDMWINYILGVLQQFKEKKSLDKGFNAVFSSTVPIGAGLSSSAAVECGFAYALNKMNNFNLTKEEIALIGQKSEHTFVGVNCGIMDQFASVFGKKNKVIKLDCTTLEYEYHNADFKKYSLLLLDSNVKHTHLTSGYNVRRQEVEQGLTVLKNHFPEVKTFRNCTEEMVNSVKQELGETIYKRSHFVVKEIQRVQDAVNALKASDFKKLGSLMTETHYGLSKEYEVSCDEIDFLVDSVSKEKTVLGARMMGGGFGGCSINLVEKGSENKLIESISKQYKTAFGIDLKAYKIKISKGTTEYKN